MVLWGHKFKSGKAAKRLDRLAPNLVHVCGFIWEAPPYPRAAFWGGFRGSTIQMTVKCGQTARLIGNQFCTCMYNAEESGNGHRLNKLAHHETPGGAF